MTIRFQYQTKAEPVYPPAAPAETIYADKWLGSWPSQLRGPAWRPLSDIAEPIPFEKLYPTVDKWQGSYPSVINKLSRRIYDSLVFVPIVVAPAETIYADKWQPSYPSRFERNKLPSAIEAGSFFYSGIYWPEVIKADKWLPTYPDMLLPKEGLLSAIQAGSWFYEWEVPYVPPTGTLYYWLRTA